MGDVIDIKEGKRIRKLRMRNGDDGDGDSRDTSIRDTSISIHMAWPNTARGIAGALVYFACPVAIIVLSVWLVSKVEALLQRLRR